MEEKVDVAGSLAATLCPSAQPDMAGSIVFGVVGGTVAEPRIGYLTNPQPATADILALADEVRATEVFRLAAPCAKAGCVRFDGASCRLAERVVRLLSQWLRYPHLAGYAGAAVGGSRKVSPHANAALKS